MASGATGLCAFYATVAGIRNAICDYLACKGMFHRLKGNEFLFLYTLYLQAFVRKFSTHKALPKSWSGKEMAVSTMHIGANQNTHCLDHLRCKKDQQPWEGAEVQQYMPSGSHQAKSKLVSSTKLHSCKNFPFLYWVSSAVPASICLAEGVAPAHPWDGVGWASLASLCMEISAGRFGHSAKVKGLLALGLEGNQGAHPRSQARQTQYHQQQQQGKRWPILHHTRCELSPHKHAVC